MVDLEKMRCCASRFMLRMGVAVSNAWIRTIMDIERKPRLHSLIMIAIPPMMTWTCDERGVCDLFLDNLLEELEGVGLQGVTRVVQNKYFVGVYETFRL